MSLTPVIESAFYVSAAILFYVYVLYPIVLVLLPPIRSRVAANGWKRPRDWPSLSLIVAAYNEERVIGEKIKNFLACNYPGRSEILIVCDGSIDATASIVSRMASPRVRLLVQQRRKGKGAALNLAVPRSRGEILVFTDATSMLAAEALTELIRPFSDHAIGLVNGRIRYQSAATANLYHRYEQLLKLLEVRGGMIATAHGALYAIRKRLWCERDPRMVNDFLDPVLVNLQGARVALAPKALCFEQFASKGQFSRQVRMVALAALVYSKLVPSLLRAGLWRSILVLTSHKFLRWCTAIWVAVLAIATPWMTARGAIYRQALIGEFLFAASVAIGGLAKRFKWSERFAVCYEFASVNVAALLGLWLCIRGRVPAVWEPSGGFTEEPRPEPATIGSAEVLAAGLQPVARVVGESQ